MNHIIIEKALWIRKKCSGKLHPKEMKLLITSIKQITEK